MKEKVSRGVVVSLVVLLTISIGTLAIGEVAAKPITVYMVPKSTGAPYFVACENGALQAVKELKALGLPIEFHYMGPSTIDTQAEIRTITSIIALHPDAILYSSNSAKALVPVLKQARTAGIKVVGYDADVADPTARDLFVNQVDFDALARELIDLVAKNVGPNAGIAIISANPNAANQNAWIAGMKQYMAKSYPKMRVVTIQYGGDLTTSAYQNAQTIINAFYPQAKAIVALTSMSFPAAAQAVLDAGLKGKIYVVGLSTPNDMKKYVEEGAVKDVVLWNPVNLGYLALYAANDLVRNMVCTVEGTKYISGGKLGIFAIGKDKVVLLGKPFVFTRQNINQFDF